MQVWIDSNLINFNYSIKTLMDIIDEKDLEFLCNLLASKGHEFRLKKTWNLAK